jgi:outer membrane protein assembly factor BamB
MVTIKPQGQNRYLSSVDLASGNTNWSFFGEGADWPTAAPLVINDMVVMGTAFGAVYLLDAATGHKLWSANTGTAILDDNTNWTNDDGSSGNGRPRSGFGGGEDVLLVPASKLLIAYKP